MDNRKKRARADSVHDSQDDSDRRRKTKVGTLRQLESTGDSDASTARTASINDNLANLQASRSSRHDAKFEDLDSKNGFSQLYSELVIMKSGYLLGKASHDESRARLEREKADLVKQRDALLKENENNNLLFAAYKKGLEIAAKGKAEEFGKLEAEHKALESDFKRLQDDHSLLSKHVADVIERNEEMGWQIADLVAEAEQCKSRALVLEGDIQELRQVHGEESRVREQRRVLPPAYGSLDEEDKPWWLQHEDAGPLELTLWETMLRSNHATNMRHLQDLCMEYPEDKGTVEATRRILITGFRVIENTCAALRQLLSQIDTVVHTKIEFLTPAAHSSTMCGEPNRDMAGVHLEQAVDAKSRVRVGEIVAKILLELPWDLVAANECFGFTGAMLNLTNAERVEVEQVHQEVDEILLEALQIVFSGPTEEGALKYAVYDLKRWDVAADYVDGGLDSFNDNTTYPPLGMSRKWLEEQMEKMRVEAAAAEGEQAAGADEEHDTGD